MRRKGGGSYYRRGNTWWIKFYRDGKAYRESTHGTRESDAKDLLNKRLGAIAEGRPVNLKAEKVLLGELFDDLLIEYTVNRRKSLSRMKELIAHLRPTFGHRKAMSITTPEVRSYVADRLRPVGRGDREIPAAANATVNRELAALKRALSLGLKANKITHRTHIEMLAENNVRQGFFERDQFEAVRRHLPEYLRPALTFCYITGWRTRSEVFPLTWAQVDFKARVVRLEPGTTKNNEGRVFYMTPELRSTLDAQREATEKLIRKTGRIIPLVFHRKGRPFRWPYKAWRTACRKAGVPGRIMHDFRRTAVRNLERAGVPRSVAMKMTGHRTEAVYRRYAIVSDSDLREAADKLAALDGVVPGGAMGTKPAPVGTVPVGRGL